MKRTRLRKDGKLNANPRVWKLPCINTGGIKVPLTEIHNISADEESMRSLPNAPQSQAFKLPSH